MFRMSREAEEAKALDTWGKLAPIIDRWQRATAGDPAELQVRARSSLARDDAAAHPYPVSTAVRHSLNAAVDHLHAAKTLVVDAHLIHQAALSTLARASLETAAAAYWVLGPRSRSDRLTHALQWHAQNFIDQHKATESRGLTKNAKAELLGEINQVAVQANLPDRERNQIRVGYRSTDVACMRSVPLHGESERGRRGRWPRRPKVRPSGSRRGPR